MLVPHAFMYTVPWERSISAARPRLESSRASSMDGIDSSRLGGIPVEMALKLGGTDLAAGQRHGLENPLVPECGFLILLLRGAVALASVFLVCVPVLFSHKKRFEAAHRVCEPVTRDDEPLFRQAYNKKSIKPITWLVLAKDLQHCVLGIRKTLFRRYERRNSSGFQSRSTVWSQAANANPPHESWDR